MQASYLYFIQNTASQLIKIGITISLEARVSQIQCHCGSPVMVLGVMWGGEEEERVVHKMFAPCRRFGEWFEPSPELLSFIEQSTHKPRPAKKERENTGIAIANGNSLTIEQAATKLGIKPDAIRKLCRRNRLKAQKFGNVWMVDGDSVIDYQGSNRKPGRKPNNKIRVNPTTAAILTAARPGADDEGDDLGY